MYSLGCMNGSFGRNCTARCGSNCISCNAVNGVCDFGCSPGWEGTFCEQGKFWSDRNWRQQSGTLFINQSSLLTGTFSRQTNC